MKSHRNEIDISACLIVRNEEAFLEGCLLSIKDIVDEIVVVDTGSTDRTPAIACDFRVQFHSLPWANDFSAARNHALRKSRGKWILSIDADERIRPLSRSVVNALVKEPSVAAYHCLEKPAAGWTSQWVLRLFQKDPRIFFKGIVHESVYDSICDVISKDARKIGKCPIVIDHLGYEGDFSDKYKRYFPLLFKEIERAPERSDIWYHLALAYHGTDRKDLAIKALDKSMELIRTKTKLLPIDAETYIDTIQFHLAGGRDANLLLKEAMDMFPQNPSLHYLNGKSLMQNGQYRKAIPFFKRLILWGQKRDFERSVSHPQKIFYIYPYDSLGACYFKLGIYDLALENYEEVCRLAPKKKEYAIKRTLCTKLAEKIPLADKRGLFSI